MNAIVTEEKLCIEINFSEIKSEFNRLKNVAEEINAVEKCSGGYFVLTDINRFAQHFAKTLNKDRPKHSDASISVALHYAMQEAMETAAFLGAGVKEKPCEKLN